MKKKKTGLYVKLTADDVTTIRELRKRFAVNISQLVRIALRRNIDALIQSGGDASR